MAGGDSSYPPDWRMGAAKDWHRIGVMLRDGDPEAAAFFLQQCLEKYLKAYLLSRGWRLRKIHQLDACWTMLSASSRRWRPIGVSANGSLATTSRSDTPRW